jgi:hypothetical protein
MLVQFKHKHPLFLLFLLFLFLSLPCLPLSLPVSPLSLPVSPSPPLSPLSPPHRERLQVLFACSATSTAIAASVSTTSASVTVLCDRRLSDQNLSNLPFVRPIHKMRHLPDLPFVRAAIRQTYTQNAPFVRPVICPPWNFFLLSVFLSFFLSVFQRLVRSAAMNNFDLNVLCRDLNISILILNILTKILIF